MGRGRTLAEDLFWFSGEQRSRIEPHLPTNPVPSAMMIAGFCAESLPWLIRS
jgi:hypothetical protein